MKQNTPSTTNISYQQALEHAIELCGLQEAFFADFQAKIVASLMQEHNMAPKHVLDYGCGDGTMAYLLSHYVPQAHIHGVDTNQDLIDIAQGWYGKNTAHLECFCETTWNKNVSRNCNLIYLANVLHHIPKNEHKKLIDKLVNKLAPNGLLIILELNPYNVGQAWRFYRDKKEQGNKMLWPHYVKKLLTKHGNTQINFYRNRIGRFTKFQQFINFIQPSKLYAVTCTTQNKL